MYLETLSALVFFAAKNKVYFDFLKLQASSHFLWWNSLVCVCSGLRRISYVFSCANLSSEFPNRSDFDPLYFDQLDISYSYTEIIGFSETLGMILSQQWAAQILIGLHRYIERLFLMVWLFSEQCFVTETLCFR